MIKNVVGLLSTKINGKSYWALMILHWVEYCINLYQARKTFWGSVTCHNKIFKICCGPGNNFASQFVINERATRVVIHSILVLGPSAFGKGRIISNNGNLRNLRYTKSICHVILALITYESAEPNF